MSDNHKHEVKLSNSYSSISVAVLIAFWCFWISDSFARVDCSLGVQQACGVITAKYTKPEQP